MACLTIAVLLIAAVWSSEAAAPPREECAVGNDMYRPDPLNCYIYYQCDPNQGWKEMECGPGTAFNPFFNVCDWPQNVLGCQSTTTDACASNPCQNGGSCSQNGNGFQCSCLPSYRGVYCETYTSPTCTHNERQTLNDGNCGTFLYCNQGTWENYKCPAGYNYHPTWRDCVPPTQYPCTTTTTGSCSSSPCRNGGACINSGSSFVCQCPSNYEGTFCEILVISNPTGPSGPCNTNIDQPDNTDCGKFFSCRSNNQWKQYKCPADAPAFNIDTGVCDYLSNVKCGTRRTLCDNDTRQPGNNTDCTQFYLCVNNAWILYNCPSGARYNHTLKDCSTTTTCATAPYNRPCSSAPCLNGGVCQDINNVNFICQCLSGYTGNLCQTGSTTNNACFSAPCQNGGICTNIGTGFTCQCPAGYTGYTCQFAPQPCTSNPCLNGGICNTQGNTYTCTCQPNYGGPRCETQFIVDGSWSSWSANAVPAYPCDKVCGGGQERYIRTRTCTNPAPSNGGRQCQGDNTDTISVPCNVGQCPCTRNPCNGQTCYDVSTTVYTCGCPPYTGGNQCANGCSYPCPPNVAIIYPDITDPTRFVACFNQILNFTSCPNPAYPTYSFSRNDCV